VHDVLGNLVEQVGIVVHGTYRADAGGLRRPLWLESSFVEFPKQETFGFGHRGIDGRKLAAIHYGFDRGF